MARVIARRRPCGGLAYLLLLRVVARSLLDKIRCGVQPQVEKWSNAAYPPRVEHLMDLFR